MFGIGPSLEFNVSLSACSTTLFWILVVLSHFQFLCFLYSCVFSSISVFFIPWSLLLVSFVVTVPGPGRLIHIWTKPRAWLGHWFGFNKSGKRRLWLSTPVSLLHWIHRSVLVALDKQHAMPRPAWRFWSSALSISFTSFMFILSCDKCRVLFRYSGKVL
jgi:hypothetical protein